MIFISTGGFKSEKSINSINKLMEKGIYDIELSGGEYEVDQIEKIITEKKLHNSLNLQVHNYFPPPRSPFVFNLGSLDEEISKISMNHALNSIELASKLKSKYYSFHAGFLLDPQVKELGKKIKKRSTYNREISKNTFIERVNILAKFAETKNITLLIENNVLSSNNFEEFKENILLMVDEPECTEIMNRVSNNVKMLVDVAHLKVSSNSLNFDRISFLKKLDKWIFAYHLSDNDGNSDSNQKIRLDSWFWPYIKSNLDYYSIEVYGEEPEELVKQKELTQRMIYN
jgi:sugar phosphate isomerase/epimerase